MDRSFYPGEQSKTWSDSEKEIILKNLLSTNKEKMMFLLPDRTWKAILHMGKKLDLKLKNNYDKIPASELFKNIDEVKHMMCKDCRRYLPFDTLHFPRDASCRYGVRSICKECKGENFGTKDYWSEEETEILIEHYETRTNRYLQENYFSNKSLEQISHRGAYLKLNKNEDIRYLAIIESQTEEWRDKISETSIKNGSHKDEKNSMFGTSRKGSENPNWQGGISQLYSHIRRNLTQWKMDSAKSCNYKCVFTGERFDEIHHLYSFHSTVNDTLNDLNLPLKDQIGDYTENELNMITDNCIGMHYEYPLGVCLKYEIHRLFHGLYGFYENTPEQFYEFKHRYLNGEFEEVL